MCTSQTQTVHVSSLGRSLTRPVQALDPRPKQAEAACFRTTEPDSFCVRVTRRLLNHTSSSENAPQDGPESR